ncbi:OLC1v1001002C1 [Oldenlandia corymbosa var. corymbosa]|uniref:OLC1v1001002C1 n=1 Tax=Oldenlandia corymbosa var. corymbosa TaxID=529605 RepID=A0AAV1D4P5_OLDCO|nr:OLC1v1001002C1 [Oldenlandia corymbosa var. corymbosa]
MFGYRPNYQFAKDNEFALSTELSMRPPVSACDASELQARVILWLARREMEDKLNQKTGKPSMQVRLIHGPYDGMSLKKSLRVFLQKRRDRIQSCLLYKQRMMNDGNLNDSKIGDK